MGFLKSVGNVISAPFKAIGNAVSGGTAPTPTIPDIDPETKALQNAYIESSRKTPDQLYAESMQGVEQGAAPALKGMEEERSRTSSSLGMDPAMNAALGRKQMQSYSQGMNDLTKQIKMKTTQESQERMKQASQMLLGNAQVQMQREQMAYDAWNNKMNGRNQAISSIFGAAGSIAGGIFGGPAGAAVGGQAGKSMGPQSSSDASQSMYGRSSGTRAPLMTSG